MTMVRKDVVINDGRTMSVLVDDSWTERLNDSADTLWFQDSSGTDRVRLLRNIGVAYYFDEDHHYHRDDAVCREAIDPEKHKVSADATYFWHGKALRLCEFDDTWPESVQVLWMRLKLGDNP